MDSKSSGVGLSGVRDQDDHGVLGDSVGVQDRNSRTLTGIDDILG